MCAIVAWIGRMDYDIVRNTVEDGAPWGPEATGLAYNNRHGTKVIKKPIHPLAFLKSHSRELTLAIKSGSGIIHVRKGTTGRNSEACAHPFQFKDITYVHNGRVENYSQLMPGAVVDSECLGELIHNRNIRAARGTVGLAWFDRHEQLYVYRCGKTLFPIKINWTDGGSSIIVVTHLSMLNVGEDDRINTMEVLEMHQGVVYRVSEDGVESVYEEFEPFHSFAEPQPIDLKTYRGG